MSFHSPAMPLPGGRPSRPGAGRPGPDTAADRFRARRQRLSRVRRRVMATGAITFVALWGVIFDQLIHEHVTSVASQTATVAATSSSGAATSASTGSSTSGANSTSSGSNGSSTSNGSGSSSGTTSNVTTSQS